VRLAARGLIGAVLATVLVAGCGGGPASTKYTQTWAKGYDITPCSDWRDVMDNHQRLVAAGDMLVTLRKKDGDGGLPTDEMIGAFALDVSDMCAARVGDIATIAQVGPLVYLAFSAEFKP
jgi:hypothetical protein